MTKNPSDIPYLEDALLAALDRMFPPLVITPTTPTNDIMFDAGRRSFIAALKAISLKQRQDELSAAR